jgi:hypothetical protein
VQLVGIILLILAQVEHKVAVAPVGIIPLVHLATITLGAHTRGVTSKAQAGIREVVGLALRLKLSITVYICRSIAITVILPKQVVPLLLAHGDTYLGDYIHIEDPIELTRRPRSVGVVVVERWLVVATVIATFVAIILITTAILAIILASRILLIGGFIHREYRRSILHTASDTHHKEEENSDYSIASDVV